MGEILEAEFRQFLKSSGHKGPLPGIQEREMRYAFYCGAGIGVLRAANGDTAEIIAEVKALLAKGAREFGEMN